MSYDRKNPYLARIEKRESLCHQDSEKCTVHIELDLAGSGIIYEVGDCVGIIPSNDPVQIEEILKLLKCTGEEIVEEKRTKTPYVFREFLTKHANIKDLTKPFIVELHKKQSHQQKKEQLEALLNNNQLFKEYQANREVWDTLEEHGANFTAQELCLLLKPMMPRFYSIASSMRAVGEKMHLTVALPQWESNQILRQGVASHFLLNLAPLDEPVVPLYILKHSGFTLPQDPKAAIIMVGPGTGVAPYRGFMQEREVMNCPGKNWLFFGEWNRKNHFFYEAYWKSLEAKNQLRVDAAFSRDQEQKIYVQHLMIQQGKELFHWIEEGAYFYVCGDAFQMAKDVDAALHEIVQLHGKLSEASAKEYIKKLKEEKRYLRDVY